MNTKRCWGCGTHHVTSSAKCPRCGSNLYPLPQTYGSTEITKVSSGPRKLTAFPSDKMLRRAKMKEDIMSMGLLLFLLLACLAMGGFLATLYAVVFWS